MANNKNIRCLCNTQELVLLYKKGVTIKELSNKYKIEEIKIKDFLEEYKEKEDYCNEKYGKGKWSFMTKEEIIKSLSNNKNNEKQLAYSHFLKDSKEE